MPRLALRSALCSLSLFAGVTTLSAQAPFEGAVTMRLSSAPPKSASPNGNAPTQEMEYLVRNGKVRVNMGGQGAGMSVRTSPQEEKLFILMPMQNAYMEMPLAAAAASAREAVPADVKVTHTGKMETIAGYSCEHVVFVSGTSPAVDVCMAKGMGSFVNPMTAMQRGSVPAWQRSIAADGGFPLKITLADGSVPVEVLKIEKKKLANELFSVPLNFTKMAMPQRR